MARIRQNFFEGTLSSQLSVGATTLQSSALSSFPAVTGSDVAYLVIDPSGANPEIVKVTAHTASSTSATIVRGQDSTTDRTWPAGTTVIQAPIASDVDASTLAADAAFTGAFSAYKDVYAWFTHPNNVAIPTGVWTPLPWNATNDSDPFSQKWYPTASLASTTVAAGSNGAVLPQGTINVADTTGFASDGYLVITGPPGASVDTVVSYTGKTSTSFTGCNSAYRGGGVGISTGTLATGQVVKQANVEHDGRNGTLHSLQMDICEVGFISIPTTAYCGIRNRNYEGFFNFAGATTHAAGCNIASPGQHIQVVMQPAFFTSNSPNRYEVFQNSGSVKQVSKDGIQSPSLMKAVITHIDL